MKDLDLERGSRLRASASVSRKNSWANDTWKWTRTPLVEKEFPLQTASDSRAVYHAYLGPIHLLFLPGNAWYILPPSEYGISCPISAWSYHLLTATQPIWVDARFPATVCEVPKDRWETDCRLVRLWWMRDAQP